jgi:hypothetical protein
MVYVEKYYLYKNRIVNGPFDLVFDKGSIPS